MGAQSHSSPNPLGGRHQIGDHSMSRPAGARRPLCHDCDRVLEAIVWRLRERRGHELDGGRGVVRSRFRTNARATAVPAR